mgnify:CR=1 FL=1
MKIRYDKKNLYCLFLLLPFFSPTVGGLEFITQIIKVYKILVGIIVIFYTIKKHEMSLHLILLSCFYGVICSSAVIHGHQIDSLVIDVLFLWLVNYMTYDVGSFKRFSNVYVKLYTVLMFVNLATMLLFPNGLYSSSAYNLNWFLGYKNVIIRLLLPYLTLMLTKNVLNNQKIELGGKEKIYFVATVISILLTQSFNSLIGIGVFCILICAAKFDKLHKKFLISKAFVIYCITDFVMLKSGFLSLFQNLIINVLEKSASERGRVAIWQHTLRMISESPLIGYGGITNEMYNFSFKISHPHNLMLYYLMLGGIIGMIVLFLAICLSESKGVKNQTPIVKKINYLFAGMYIAFFSMGYMESLTGATMLIPMLAILYNINNMELGSERDENRFMYTV